MSDTIKQERQFQERLIEERLASLKNFMRDAIILPSFPSIQSLNFLAEFDDGMQVGVSLDVLSEEEMKELTESDGDPGN